MRKRDCLYLHALCVLVRREVEDRGDLPGDVFEQYEDLDVGPSEIHRPKADHRRALLELLDALAEAVEGGDDAVSPLRTGTEVGGDRGRR